MKAKCLSILIYVLLLSSCNNPFCISPNSHSTKDEDLIAKILYEGDTVAYNQFYNHWSDNGAADRCLAYSLVMANKYHYAPACSHVYEILANLYSTPTVRIDGDPDIAVLNTVVADIDSAIAAVAENDPSLNAALNSIDRGLDYLDAETRSLALSYLGRSLL